MNWASGWPWARRGLVTAMLVREVGLLLGMGLAIGLGGTLALAGLMRTALFGLTPRDPAALLSAVGLAAAYLPARRASQLDPRSAAATGIGAGSSAYNSDQRRSRL
jgi:ABC-type antimicrobial peptide transport system permease subunit